MMLCDEAKCGRERVDGSERMTMDGGALIGGAIRCWGQTEQAVGACPGSGSIVGGFAAKGSWCC